MKYTTVKSQREVGSKHKVPFGLWYPSVLSSLNTSTEKKDVQQNNFSDFTMVQEYKSKIYVGAW